MFAIYLRFKPFLCGAEVGIRGLSHFFRKLQPDNGKEVLKPDEF